MLPPFRSVYRYRVEDPEREVRCYVTIEREPTLRVLSPVPWRLTLYAEPPYLWMELSPLAAAVRKRFAPDPRERFERYAFAPMGDLPSWFVPE